MECIGFVNLPKWQDELQKLLMHNKREKLLSSPVLGAETSDNSWKSLEREDFFSCVRTGIVFEDNIPQNQLPQVVVTNDAELAVKRIKSGLWADTFYSAAVGGTFPALKMASDGCFGTIKKILVQNDSVAGYVLSRMDTAGKSLEEAAHEAQWEGVALENPNRNLHGFVVRDRLVLQIAELFGVFVEPEKIKTVGASTLEKIDCDIAKEFSCSIRLIGIASYEDGVLKAEVEPCMMPSSYLLAQTRAGGEIIYMKTTDDTSHVYSGSGTSHAMQVRGILCDLESAKKKTDVLPVYEKALGTFEDSFYVRFNVADITGTLSDLLAVFSRSGIEISSVHQPVSSVSQETSAGMFKTLVLITGKTSRVSLFAVLEKIKASVKLAAVCACYRFIKRA